MHVMSSRVCGWSLCLLLLLLSLTSATQNPGLKVRLTQHGLDYAAKQAIQSLSDRVTGQSIQDFSGKTHVTVGSVQYRFTGIHITQFSPPASTVTVQPNTGLTWTISGASLSIHGNWWYKYRLGFITHHSDGDFDVSASGIGLSISIFLGMKDGRPTISSSNCHGSIGDVRVKFHGGDSWLINIFNDKIEHTLEDKLRGILCDAANKAVNTDAEKALTKLDLNYSWKEATLDYSLVAAPAFGKGYLDTFHKAEVTWNGDPKPPSVTPPPIPESSDTTHMINFWLNDYLMDTMGEMLTRHGILAKNLTNKDLDGHSGILNTTCASSATCIGQMITQLAKTYPNCEVMLEMHETNPPTVDFSRGGVAGQFAGEVNYFVQLPNGTTVYALTTVLSFRAFLQVKLTGTNLTAQITHHKITVNVTEMNPVLGPITPTLNRRVFTFFDTITTFYIDAQLNEKGAEGFSLPKTRNAAYVNPALKIQGNSLWIMTDVKYTPGGESREPEETAVLMKHLKTDNANNEVFKNNQIL